MADSDEELDEVDELDKTVTFVKAYKAMLLMQWLTLMKNLMRLMN
jgi:hypothetical protein